MFMLVSCGGGEDSPNEPTPTPNPTPNEPTASITMNTNIPSGGLAFDVTGGEKSVSFTTNKNWTVTVAATTGGTTWCTASPTSGSQGDAIVKFTVKENTDYDDRSVSVTIKAGTATKTFTINQKGADALLVTTDKYEVAQEGGEIEVEVQANIDYEMEISETAKSWITEAATRALTTHKHTFTIAANEEVDKREGEIIFKSGDKVEIVKVYQACSPVLVLSQNEFNVSDAGEVISIDVKSNIDFGVQMPDVDWIVDEAATRGMSSHTLKYDILPNETYDAREAEIIFYDKNSELKETVKVVQAQKDAIIISNKSYEVKAEGETIEVKLSANVEFDVTMPDVDWISQVTTRGLTEHTLYYKVAENTGEDSRSAEIVFTNKEDQLSEKIVVNQKCKRILSLDKTECTVSGEGEIITVQVKSNVDYLYSIDFASWITTTRSASTETMKFVIAPNESYNSRSAEIVFFATSGDWLEATLKVVQNPKSVINISQKEFNVSSEGKTIGINLSTNVDFDITMPDVDWISQVNTRGLDEYTLYFEVKENLTVNERIAEIVFVDKKSQLSETVIIKQEAAKGNYANGVAALSKSGILRTILGNGYLDITSLKIIGPIDGSDICCLRQMLGGDNFRRSEWGKLFSLDLSEAIIIEGGSSYYESYKKLYTMNNVVGESMFTKCNNLQSIILPNNTINIEYDSFNSCTSLNYVKISDNTTYIGGNAFGGCTSLTEITIPKSVTEIDNSAFIKCSSLSSITIFEGLEKIGGYAFYGCSSLTSISIPNSVIEIGNTAFYDCSSLATANIPSSLEKLEPDLFGNCSSLVSISIPNSVYSIEDGVFRGCASLTSITIPEDVEGIGKNAFGGCKSLKSIAIPKSISTIKEGTFSGCSSLTSITIPNGVSVIEDKAFQSCKSLKSIIFPSTITSVGGNVFWGTYNIEEFYCFAQTPPKLGTQNFFSGADIFYVPENSKDIYLSSNWSDYFDNIVEIL